MKTLALVWLLICSQVLAAPVPPTPKLTEELVVGPWYSYYASDHGSAGWSIFESDGTGRGKGKVRTMHCGPDFKYEWNEQWEIRQDEKGTYVHVWTEHHNYQLRLCNRNGVKLSGDNCPNRCFTLYKLKRE